MEDTKAKPGLSLQFKIMLCAGMTILLSTGISTILYIKDFKENYLEAIEWRSVSLTQSINVDIQTRYDLFGAVSDTRLILESAYIQCKKLYDANRYTNVAFVSILSPEGEIITHNDKSLWGKTLASPLAAPALQSHDVTTILIGRFYHTLVPIVTRGGVCLGAIDVGFPQEVVDDKIKSTMNQATLLCIILFPVVFLIFFILVRRFVSNPIGKLIAATGDIARGNLSRNMFVDRTRELWELSTSLTRMREAIRTNIMAVEQKNREVKALIACSPVALFSIDHESRVAIWTEPAERLLGWSAKEVTGAPPPFLLPGDRQRFEELCDGVWAGNIRQGYEFICKNKKGETLHVSLSMAPIRDSDEMILGMMGAMEDISGRIAREKAYQETRNQLVQAQKLESVGRLAGGVAHDYNNTLGIILGYAELILDNLSPEDPAYYDMQEIITATKHSADITRQLLAFARKQTIAPKVFDLNRQVEKMLKMLRRLIGEDIRLTWSPQDQPGLVKLDTTQLDQILVNLCINARDAMASGGVITIATGTNTIDEQACAGHPEFRPGEFVSLSISDTGAGMEKETLEQIFEPFFTTKSGGKGTGLGLATVYGIVKQNNGFIDVTSKPLQGTAFRIFFPRYGGALPQSSPDSVEERFHGNGETVLLVEDEQPILIICQNILEKMGFRVIPAQNPRDAITLAKSERAKIELLITDVILPEMNGCELATHLKASCPDLKTLFMSGYTANVIAHSGVLEEGVQFIQKPFTRKELTTKIRMIFECPRAHPANAPGQP